MPFFPETAEGWAGLTGAACGFIAAGYAAYQWAPGAFNRWTDRRIEKQRIARGLVNVVESFPPFMTRMEDTFETIAENGKRLLNIEQQQSQQTVMIHSIIETLPQEVVWTDADGEPRAVSRGFTAMTGMDHITMRDGGWKRMVHPDDLDEVEERWEAARSRGQVFRHVYHIHNINDKHGYFEVECLAIPMTSKSGWKAVFTKTADTINNSPVSASTNTPIL